MFIREDVKTQGERMEETLLNQDGAEEITETEVVETPNYEEIISQLRTENSKLKKATDKATSEASNFKKQLREKMSEDERLAQEKAEKEAELQMKYEELLRKNNISDYTTNAMTTLGVSKDEGERLAVALMDNDVESVFACLSDVVKAISQREQDKFLSSRTPLSSGANENSVTGVYKTKSEIMAIKDRTLRQKAIAENMHLFK